MQINSFNTYQFDKYPQSTDASSSEACTSKDTEKQSSPSSYKMKSDLYKRYMTQCRNKIYDRPSKQKDSCKSEHKSELYLRFMENCRKRKLEGTSKQEETDKPEFKDVKRFKPNGFTIGDFGTSQQTDSGLILKYKSFTQQFTRNRSLKRTRFLREIEEKNSLFLSRKIDRESRMSILSAASNVDKAKQADKDRFMNTEMGVTRPNIDFKNEVILKGSKNPDIHAFATMIRKEIEERGLKNIVLPTREMWREKNKEVTLEDGSKKKISSPIYIENLEKDIIDVDDVYKIYKERPHLFNKIVEEITELYMVVEVGDTCLDEERYEQYAKQVETNDLVKQIFPIGCYCNFDNLAVQRIIDDQGIPSIKFVLVDLDIVRLPTYGTVHRLLKMFPSHKDIIKSIVDRDNPGLIEKINMNTPTLKENIPSVFEYTEELLRKIYESKLRYLPKAKSKVKVT